MKKMTIFVFALLAALLLVIGCILWVTHAKYHPRRVLCLPKGFINLQYAIESANGVIKYIFFEEYISLVDREGSSVGGSLVRDRSFIVDYRGEYYVNAEKYNAALEKAKQMAAIGE